MLNTKYGPPAVTIFTYTKAYGSVVTILNISMPWGEGAENKGGTHQR